MPWSVTLLTALYLSTQVWAILQQPLLKPSLLLNPYPNQQRLHFTKDDTFKLLILTDTHLLDDQDVAGNASNVNKASANAVKYYLDKENPDFVVHLGDLISGERAKKAQDVVDAVRQILNPMKNAGIPFATTKGNHDNDKYSTHGFITDIEKKHFSKLSYTRKAPVTIGGGDTGTDNYWIPIYENRNVEHNNTPKLILWFFDSRSGKELLSRGGAQIDDWVDYSVADWIESEVKKMETAWKEIPPSLLFVHIPLHASYTTQTQAPYKNFVGGITDETPSNFTKSSITYKGLNDDLPVASQGGENDKVPYSGQDKVFIEAFMRSAAGKTRIHGIVSGHDHGNDWCAPGNLKTAAHQIVPLCFAKHSGFGGYDYDQWNHGTRVFIFNLRNINQSVQTYVRFLTGEKRYITQLSDNWANLAPSSIQ